MRTIAGLFLLATALPIQAQDFWNSPSQLPGAFVDDFAVDTRGIHWAISDGALQLSSDTMATWSEYDAISLPDHLASLDGKLYVTTFSDGYFIIDESRETNFLSGISTGAIAPLAESDVRVAGGAGILWTNASGTWEIANLPLLSISDESADEIYRVGGVTIYQALDFEFDPYTRFMTDVSGSFQLIDALEIELAYSDGATLYVTGSEFDDRSKVFRSQDGGLTFEELGAVPDDEWITAFAVEGQTIIASTLDGSVLLSQDLGASWLDASSGLTDTPEEFYISPDGYAYAIEDNDVYRSAEPLESASGVNVQNQLPATVGLSVYPNPTGGRATVKVVTPSDQLITVDVFDVLGREVRTLGGDIVPAGEYYFIIDGLARGTYFIQSGSRTRSIVIR